MSYLRHDRGHKEPIKAMVTVCTQFTCHILHFTLFQKVGSWLERKLSTQRKGANLISQVMDDLNRKLAEWKPPEVSPMDAGMSPIRVC